MKLYRIKYDICIENENKYELEEDDIVRVSCILIETHGNPQQLYRNGQSPCTYVKLYINKTGDRKYFYLSLDTFKLVCEYLGKSK
jgi:hypothetical protein